MNRTLSILLLLLGLVLALPGASYASHVCDVEDDVEDYIDYSPSLSGDAKTCAKQCKVWAKGCVGVARGSAKCAAAATSAHNKIGSVSCDDLEGQAKGQCKKDENEENKQELGDLKELLAEMLGLCSEALDDCLASCD